MVAEKNPDIRKAVNTLYELSADEQTRAQYELHLRAVRDRAWLKDDGIQEGWKKGLQEGLQQGRLEGQREGWQKGQQAGWQKGQQEGWQKGQQAGAQALLELIKSGKSPDEAMAILNR